jgi:hypothetical protein
VKLYPREQRLLEMRLREKAAWPKVAKELGVTTDRAKAIEKHILVRLLAQDDAAEVIKSVPVYGCGICGGARVTEASPNIEFQVRSWLNNR